MLTATPTLLVLGLRVLAQGTGLYGIQMKAGSGLTNMLAQTMDDGEIRKRCGEQVPFCVNIGKRQVRAVSRSHFKPQHKR